MDKVRKSIKASLLLKPGDPFNGGIVDRIEGHTIHYTVKLPDVKWSEPIVTRMCDE